MKKSQIVSGLVAVGIYICFLVLLVLYFNIHSDNKQKRYVKKDEHKIHIALANMPFEKKQKKTVKKKLPKLKKPPKAKKKKHIIKKKSLKHTKSIKKRDRKVLKKTKVKRKIVKKQKIKTEDKNITKKQQRIKTTDLFANLKVKQKKHPLITISDKPIISKPKQNLIKLSDKPSALKMVNSSLKKQKNMDSGVSNQYLARVQRILEDWPAQSEFAGESVKVLLFIKPNGKFEFEIKSASSNPNFNEALIEYLRQLQPIGFGRHKGHRTYNFEANFVAKE